MAMAGKSKELNFKILQIMKHKGCFNLLQFVSKDSTSHQSSNSSFLDSSPKYLSTFPSSQDLGRENSRSSFKFIPFSRFKPNDSSFMHSQTNCSPKSIFSQTLDSTSSSQALGTHLDIIPQFDSPYDIISIKKDEAMIFPQSPTTSVHYEQVIPNQKTNYILNSLMLSTYSPYTTKHHLFDVSKQLNTFGSEDMAYECGRGDKKTKRGKRFKGSYGNARPSKGKVRRLLRSRYNLPVPFPDHTLIPFSYTPKQG